MPIPGPVATLQPTRILVIDDDPDVLDMVSSYFRKHGCDVITGKCSADMSEALGAGDIDVVLLDLGLDGEDGMELARAARQLARVPVILVTGRHEEADRVLGLELGADDYVTKPFNPRELLARVRAVVRRYREEAHLDRRNDEPRAYRFAGWELNLGTRRLTAPGGRRVRLTNGDFDLLVALCAAPRRVLSREQLLSMSRKHREEVDGRAIDVQVRRLRMKIEADPSRPRFIVTEYRAGYRFEGLVEKVP